MHVEQAKFKRLPIGIQTFSTIIEEDYIYVDKTKHMYDLISTGSRYFFSRPRRFGKSLLVSTLAELFRGNRKLFKNLWIDGSDYQWSEHQVIELSFSALAHNTGQELQADLVWKVEQIAVVHGIDLSHAPSLQTKFYLLIEQLSKKAKVVLLIDEYDYPILSNINDIAVAKECRKVLQDFFAVIKDADRHLRFVFLTGVSKFSKTAVFSGLNNLQDISLSLTGATLLGYTHSELVNNFRPYLEKSAQKNNSTVENVLEQMADWYDGYRFGEFNDEYKVFNPFSVLLFLSEGKFLDYWFETGTPTFLMDLIKTKQFPVLQLDDIKATVQELGTFEVDDIPLKTILYQTGYLTVESYNSETENYTLDFPNFEVRSSFLKRLLLKISSSSLSTINDYATRLLAALASENVDLFCRLLQTFFADIPSGVHIPLERYYQTIMYVMVKVLGLKTHVEVSTNIGRIDFTIELPSLVYIFECKIQGSAQAALAQIEEKKYAQKFELSGKKIICVGIFFDTEKRNVQDWVVKECL